MEGRSISDRLPSYDIENRTHQYELLAIYNRNIYKTK